jgi:hypothetical protein
MEAVISPETTLATLCLVPEDRDLRQAHCDNFKTHTEFIFARKI